ncbi:hypothetical protein ACJJTC_002691 [Scirpophaga incertulas]
MQPDFTCLNNDKYTYEYFLQQDVCRFCWNTEAEIEIDIKTLQLQNCVKNELIEKINDCLNIDIVCVNWPRKLCSLCCCKLQEFYDFKRFCRETDRRLQEIINTKSTLVKIEKSEEILKENIANIEGHFSDDSICLSNYCNDGTTTLDVEIQPYSENNKELKNEGSKLKRSANSKATKYNQFDLELNYMEKNILADIKMRKVSFRKSRNTQKEVFKKKVKHTKKVSDTYCIVCRTDFSSKNELATHILIHGIEGNLYKCFGCDKRLKTPKARYNHESLCKGLKDGYRCELCNIFLPLRITYESHMTHHRKNLPIELPDNLFQCTKCTMSFNTKLLLVEHMTTHANGKKTYVCESCGRVFSRRDYLYKHGLTHTGTKRYACPHCDSKFAQRSSLTVHIRKHTGERPYSCDLCPQRCVSSSNLRAHRRRHVGHKQFECAVCNKKFGYKISLEEHIATVHERSRSFACEHCGAIYTRQRGLRRHLAAKHRKHDNAEKATPIDDALCQEKTTEENVILSCV